MSGEGPRRGLKAYLGVLLATILFPLLWMKAMRLARRHAGDDPRAPAKVAAAIVASLAILAGGAFALVAFQADAKAVMYASLNDRLAVAVGEAEYKDAVATIGTADKAIPTIEGNLANATAAGDEAKMAELSKALNETRKSRNDAQAKAQQLEPNHALYRDINASARAQDDGRIRALFATAPAYPPDAAANADAALAVKDRSVGDMQRFSLLFLWPSLAGAFFAPLAFALGSILRRSFTASDTVGFKPYPGAAAGLFLLFGAFGLPSIPFAAWTFHDAFGRSEEGQISL